MPYTLGLPLNVVRTNARVCENCALRLPAPELCRRLIDPDGSTINSVVADKARKRIQEYGQCRARCQGHRYEYMVADHHRPQKD